MKAFYILSISFALLACKKTDPSEQAKLDDTEIKEYLEDKNIDAVKLSNGVYLYKSQEGNGVKPNQSSDVQVAYKGYYTNDGVFEESEPEGVVFNLQNVIEGWTTGIPEFKQGGKGTLFIPSKLGYGPDGRGSIPGNKVLIFDIHLIEVF